MLTVTPLVLTTPAHATPAHDTDNNNAVELTVGSDVNLKQSSTNPYLYDATTPVRIKANPRGFNLTIHADSADLVNTKDNSRRIKGTIAFIDKESGREMLMGMNANSWGYRLEEGYGTKHMPDGFMHVPAGDEAPSVIVDTESEYDNAGCKGKKQCEVHMTFGAAILPNSLAAGKYSTTVTYTATAKLAPKPTYIDWPQRTVKTDPSEVCRSGDNSSSCLVDLDPNMIPVKYIGDEKNAKWESVANPEDDKHPGEWYDYKDNSKKDTKWANAVTVVNPQDYKGQAKPVKQSDILGFWVYIPRYRYKVLRFSPKDPVVSAQNFTIEFENKDSTKAIPTATGDWATHPAFTFGLKNFNGIFEKNELNGIWFAKFETTGTTDRPTVLPNEAHISGNYKGMNNQVGNFYSLAKTLGVEDRNNVGGSGFTTTPRNHHLTKFSSHMVNNNDWGAATYLSASKYGAGYNKVQINSSAAEHTNYGDTYSITGCGPWENGNTSSYGNSNDSWIDHKGISVGSLGTQQACSTDNPQRAYNGTIGQLASTTNNPTGIYDMSGGGWEYTASSYTSDLNNSNTTYFSQSANPPYVNNYNFTDPNKCNFATCGGQALYETNNGTNNSSTAQWNGNYMYFVTFSSPWFARGGIYYRGSYAGLFYAGRGLGYASSDYAFRVALVPALQD